jgi:hypothetical protein
MTDLTVTDHALVRMAQRGIPPSDVDLIVALGSEVEDGILVCKKDLQSLERTVRHILKRLKRIEGKRLVVTNGHLITAFHASPRECRRLIHRR